MRDARPVRALPGGKPRELPRRQPADGRPGGLRAARGADHRRGHVRPAGPRPARRHTATRCSNYILGTLQPEHGPRVRRLSRHRRVLAPVHGPLVTPTDIDGDPNPYFDDLDGNGTPDGRIAIREGYIRERLPRGRRQARRRADADGRQPDDLRRLRSRLRAAVVRGQRRQGPLGRRAPDPGADRELPGRRGAATVNLAKACWAGGTAQIYVNLAGRDPGGVVATDDYEARTAIRSSTPSRT